ncbi:MAG: RdgB/HAM1 family non-canonical purine NTP pyrophosphatase [Rickettsiales bacterium]|nr:RdgB/HAM1 family non-canonical purine NTP pyrophosphatase [Rickettsiales bacterium]
MDTILLATKNKGKIKEMRDIIKNVNITSLDDFDIEEPKETGSTFAENSSLKAKYYGEKLKISAIADDSGLCVDGLNNFPGIYSARFNNGCKDYSYSFNALELLLKYNNIRDYSAHFVCNVSFYDFNTKITTSFEGVVKGKLKFPPSGNGGFGYDPIFVPDSYSKTFGEMSADEKNTISHRARAIKKLSLWYQNR